jgi:hypothetical protein
LDDFGEVSGRVVWWQQRELGATRRRDVLYLRLENYTWKGIDFDFGRIAR